MASGLERRGGQPPPVRAIIKLTYRCNSRCLFCRADDYRGKVADLPAADVVRRIQLAREQGAEMVLFSGGEPTLRPDLPLLARAASSLGLKWGLITNARRLAYKDYREALLRLGMCYVHTSLHGAQAGTHDEIVQCPAFAQVLEAIQGIAAAGIELHVNTVITRLNLPELCGISDLLAPLGPVSHKLCLMEPRGNFLLHLDRLLVNPEVAAQAALYTLERARRLHQGVQTVLEGFPLCQIWPASDAVSGLLAHNILWMSEAFEEAFYPTDHGERVFPDVCEGCTLRASCPGVYVWYAQRFGGQGLEPRP